MVGSRRGGGGLRDGWTDFCAYLPRFWHADARKSLILGEKSSVTSLVFAY